MNQLYKFGEFSLNSDKKTLHRGEEAIALTPKMYEMLLVMIRNPNRALEKDFLLREVWPDSFVEEGNISFNVARLRRALSDDAQSPRYIETVQRRGYRFVAKVEGISLPDNSQAGGPPEGENSKESRRGSTQMIAVSVVSIGVIISLVGFLLLYFNLRDGDAAPILSKPFALQKLSTDGNVFHAAVSSDGKIVVYSRKNAGKQSLWICQLDTADNREIIPPSDFIYYGLALSPDGKVIYFTRGPGSTESQQLEIFRESILGGVPQKIVNDTQGWISLAPDGEKISFVRCPYGEEEYCSLWIADSRDGGHEKKLVSRSGRIRISDNKISPDGRSIAFAYGQSRTAGNEFGLSQVNIETGAESEISTEKFFNIKYISWLPSQKGILISARRQMDKSFRIWHVDQLSGVAEALTNDSENYSILSLDESGSVLIASQVAPQFHMNLYRVEGPASAPTTLASGLMASYSPDGRIVFSSNKGGNDDIWVMRPDSTDERQLTSDPAADISPVVSFDGGTIYFSSNRSGDAQIWRMNADGSDQEQITREEGGMPLLVSHDGMWLYYRSAIRTNLRRLSLKDGKETIFFARPSNNSVVSPDGRYIALAENLPGQSILRLFSAADGSEIKSFSSAEPRASILSISWSNDGSVLGYILIDRFETKPTVWFQSITGFPPHRSPDLIEEEMAESSGLAFSPDDKTFAVSQGKWNNDIVLISGLKLH